MDKTQESSNTHIELELFLLTLAKIAKESKKDVTKYKVFGQ